MTMLTPQGGELPALHALIDGWRPDPAPLIVIAGSTAIYALGVHRARQRAPHGHRAPLCAMHVRAFAAAVLVAAVALLSPLDAWSSELFAAHMTQHVLLATVVPPLAVLGAPVVAALWACPRPLRRRLVGFVRRRAWIRRAWWAATAPALAWLLHALAIWAWHAPRAYELALHGDGIHALEHLSFLGTGMLLWWGIVHPRTDRRTAYSIGILTVFATAMQTGVLGALFTLAPRVLYPVQAGGAAAAAGLTPLADQQLAGLIMWVPGGLLYVVAMSVLFVKWLEPPRRTRVAVVAALPTLIGCSRARPGPVPGGDVERGRQTLAAMGCGACHTIDGVSGAQGQVGPPLTGIANRVILAGELPNTPQNMIRWIENPPAVEPNTAMPNLDVSENSARDMVAYLYTLR